MKTQIGGRRSEVGSQDEQSFGINYSWADNKGRMHLGRSVGSGRDRAHAERRFFNQHKHVMREAGGVYQELLILILILVAGCLVTALGITRAELRERDEAIAHFEQQHVIQSHILQTNALARDAAQEGGSK